MLQTRLRALAHERTNGDGEGSSERIRLDRANVSIAESGEGVRGKVVVYAGNRHVVGDAEGEVQVGEAVAAVHGERAHSGPGNDALILFREPQ